ncbi:MAG TPA: hypothetical protein VFP61_08795 [Acidimicrobiales bacterium]|nr:hypothetical protein [Acidimicrobiales bacterium]
MTGRRATAALAAAGLAALAGCGAASSATSAGVAGAGGAGGSGAAAGGRLPLATAVKTGTATWATLAVGALHDPANTFWVLLERAHGSAAWVDQTQGTDTATNGGVLESVARADATAGGGTAGGATTGAGPHLLVAVAPSQLLAFSPVVTSGPVAPDGTTSFTAAGPAPGLQASAAALAARGAGAVGVAAAGDRLVASADVATGGWSTLATAAAIGNGSTCGTPVLHAVAVTSGGLLAGGSCPGRGVGLWSSAGTPGAAWAPVTVALPATDGRAADVAWAAPDPVGSGPGGGAVALLVDGPVVLAAHVGAAGPAQVSPPRPAGALDAVTATPDGGVAVVTGPAAAPAVARWSPGSGRWVSLPAPPAGTAVVTVGADGLVTALAATPLGRPTTVTAWSLAPGASQWQRGQVLDLAVPFGSSG